MDAYPQIINASWIFPGQHLCIPVKPQDQDMKVMLIEFIGANGFALQEIDNYVQLEPLTIIKAEVPAKTHDYIFVIACTGKLCVKSKRIGVSTVYEEQDLH